MEILRSNNENVHYDNTAVNSVKVSFLDRSPSSDLILYQTEDGKTRIQCRFEDESIWLTQAQIAELFQTTPQSITQHIRSIYDENELDETATCKPYLQVRAEGSRQVKRQLNHYSLPVILATGFRVRSRRGTQFRQWANEPLSEYLVKGFAMDDQRLKEPVKAGLPDYFDELLERIRDIRGSEQRLYLRIKDILALASDYQASDSETQKMFQTVQNKRHFAVTGLTAPEIIAKRANSELPNMGLTSWKGSRVLKGDVKVAKNDLKEEEIKELNRIVGMFLDFAEDQAQRRKQVFLKDWPERLDAFLSFNDRGVLPGLGSISRDAAEQQAFAAYDKFNERRRLVAEDQGALDAMAALEDAARLAEKQTMAKEDRP